MTVPPTPMIDNVPASPPAAPPAPDAELAKVFGQLMCQQPTQGPLLGAEENDDGAEGDDE